MVPLGRQLSASWGERREEIGREDGAGESSSSSHHSPSASEPSVVGARPELARRPWSLFIAEALVSECALAPWRAWGFLNQDSFTQLCFHVHKRPP